MWGRPWVLHVVPQHCGDNLDFVVRFTLVGEVKRSQDSVGPVESSLTSLLIVSEQTCGFLPNVMEHTTSSSLASAYSLWGLHIPL